MSYLFDGSESIDFGSVAAYRITGDLTLSCWLRYDSLTAGSYQNPLISVRGADNDNSAENYLYRLSLDSDKKLRMFWEYGGGTNLDALATAAGTINASTWHHIAYVRDATARLSKFYVDGVQVGSSVSYTAGQAPSGGGNGSLIVGAERAIYSLHARLAEVGVWAAVLSADDVATLAAGRAPGSIGGATRRAWAPLRSDAVEKDQAVTGTVTGAAQDADHPTVHVFPASVRGTASIVNAYEVAARGVHRVGYESYAASHRGEHRIFNVYARSERGTFAIFATFERDERGKFAAFAGYESSLRGTFKSTVSFTAALRGAFAVLRSYAANLRGRYRIANDALDRYELHVGVDEAPDFDAAPAETFTSLPHVAAAFTAPVSGERTYHLVLRRRNRWGLSSLNVLAQRFTIDSTGAIARAVPSGPTAISAEPAGAGGVRVRAEYAYDLDGSAQADAWLIYSRSNGTDPDPATDTPAIVGMAKADGVARLNSTIGPYLDAVEARVLVRVRRTGPPIAGSRNTAIVTAIANTDGPPVVTDGPGAGGVFIQDVSKQHQIVR